MPTFIRSTLFILLQLTLLGLVVGVMLSEYLSSILGDGRNLTLMDGIGDGCDGARYGDDGAEDEDTTRGGRRGPPPPPSTSRVKPNFKVDKNDIEADFGSESANSSYVDEDAADGCIYTENDGYTTAEDADDGETTSDISPTAASSVSHIVNANDTNDTPRAIPASLVALANAIDSTPTLRRLSFAVRKEGMSTSRIPYTSRIPETVRRPTSRLPFKLKGLEGVVIGEDTTVCDEEVGPIFVSSPPTDLGSACPGVVAGFDAETDLATHATIDALPSAFPLIDISSDDAPSTEEVSRVDKPNRREKRSSISIAGHPEVQVGETTRGRRQSRTRPGKSKKNSRKGTNENDHKHKATNSVADENAIPVWFDSYDDEFDAAHGVVRGRGRARGNSLRNGKLTLQGNAPVRLRSVSGERRPVLSDVTPVNGVIPVEGVANVLLNPSAGHYQRDLGTLVDDAFKIHPPMLVVPDFETARVGSRSRSRSISRSRKSRSRSASRCGLLTPAPPLTTTATTHVTAVGLRIELDGKPLEVELDENSPGILSDVDLEGEQSRDAGEQERFLVYTDVNDFAPTLISTPPKAVTRDRSLRGPDSSNYRYSGSALCVDSANTSLNWNSNAPSAFEGADSNASSYISASSALSKPGFDYRILADSSMDDSKPLLPRKTGLSTTPRATSRSRSSSAAASIASSPRFAGVSMESATPMIREALAAFGDIFASSSRKRGFSLNLKGLSALSPSLSPPGFNSSTVTPGLGSSHLLESNAGTLFTAATTTNKAGFGSFSDRRSLPIPLPTSSFPDLVKVPDVTSPVGAEATGKDENKQDEGVFEWEDEMRMLEMQCGVIKQCEAV